MRTCTMNYTKTKFSLKVYGLILSHRKRAAAAVDNEMPQKACASVGSASR